MNVQLELDQRSRGGSAANTNYKKKIQKQ